MTGRFAGPFNLFRDSNTKGRLVKNYAAKLLANVERIVDRPGGSKFQKLVSQHGDLLFTAMVDKTGPRPIRRVLVTGLAFDVVEQKVVEQEVALILFESGLLIQADAYLSAADDVYFAGAGTLFLPENTQHHIQGRYPSRDFNWALVEPVHSVEDTVYTTEGYTSGVPEYHLNGSMYTGLMVAALQGKYGRGQEALGDVSDLFPWDTTDDSYKYYGLMRAPDYTYFAIRTDNTSCKACRMQTTSWAEDLRERLIAGSFSAEDAIRAEAVLMSTLSPVLLEDDSLDEYLLLGETDVTPVEDPVIGQPLAYGWHYSEDGLSECAIIRHGTTYFDVGECPSTPLFAGVQYTAYKTVISFSFAQDAPGDPYNITASVETTEEGTVWWNYKDTTTIWTPDSTHTLITSFWSRQCETDYVSTPIYCWYDTDGYHDVWINIERTDVDEIHIPAFALRRTCTYTYAKPTISLTDLGGAYGVSFTIDGGADVGDLITPTFDETTGAWSHSINPINDTWNEYVSNVNISPETPDTFLFNKKNAMGICPVVSTVGLRYPIYSHIIEYSEDWENVHKIYDKNIEASNYVPPFATALIIPRHNASAVAILTRTARTLDSRQDYTDSRIGDPLNEPIYFGYCKWVEPDDTEFFFNGGFGVGQTGFIGSGTEWIVSSATKHTNLHSLDTSTLDTTNVDERVNTAKLVFAGEEIELQLEQDTRWDGYFNSEWNNGVDAIHFSAPASLMKNIKYPTKGVTPSEPALSGDYTAEAEILSRFSFEDSPVYWIGWA